MKKEKRMFEGMQISYVKYLYNIAEQDHRFIKQHVRSTLGLKSHKTAIFILDGELCIWIIKRSLSKESVCPKLKRVPPLMVGVIV
ncbi:DDE-type integrase/transposase/recombinase [Bacillus toyonensis]|nr:DDE-type integrase/transposase/recombinase [Bacillus toyonensis]